MQVKYSFLCDAANLSISRSLNALGIFDAISAKSFPWIHPRFTYVANVEFHRSELGTHRFKLIFVGPEGREIIPPLSGELSVTPQSLRTSIVSVLSAIRFPAAGVYQFDLTIDNVHVCSDALTVTAAPAK